MCSSDLIGGSFRVPEILRESGAILREVGTTNRTHLRDFHDAMGERTSAILRTHPSNYRIQGFTSSPSHTELASLAADHGIHYFVDQGCGIVSDLRSFGVQDEPTVREIVNSGADAVCFSGDKLLGGPQAGIIVGKKTILDKMHKHPLFRTFRPGKETYHFLTRVLEFHLSGRTSEIPLYGMALTSLSKLRRRGRKIFKGVTNPLLSLAIVSMDAQFGGGTTPLVNLPSLGIEVMPPEEKEESLFTHLLHSDPPVVATHREGRVFLNLLSVNPNQINDLVRALNSYQ